MFYFIILILIVIVIYILLYLYNLFQGNNNIKFKEINRELKDNKEEELEENIINEEFIINDIEENIINEEFIINDIQNKDEIINNVKDNQKNKKKWKTEELCREIAENIFKDKFPTCHPNFLKNPFTGRNLELDCYCENLGIAIEYNGIQHYKFPNPFHKSKKDFIKQIERDKYKKQMCKINGIFLIIIPYTIKNYQIKQFILDEYNKEKNKLNIENIISFDG